MVDDDSWMLLLLSSSSMSLIPMLSLMVDDSSGTGCNGDVNAVEEHNEMTRRCGGGCVRLCCGRRLPVCGLL